MKTGLLGAGLKSTDYSISLSNTLIPKTENNFAKNKITYNQGNSYACTLFACFTLISNKFGILFTDEFLFNQWDIACSQGANPKAGWYISSAVDFVRRWFNNQPDLVAEHGKLITGFAQFPYSWASDYNEKLNLIDEIFRSGHDIVGGHSGSSEYNEDFKSDGILNLKKLSNPSYNHCICMSADIQGYFDMDSDILVANSWKGTANNVYRIQHIQDLVDNAILFNTFYTFFSEKDNIEFNKLAYNVSGELADRFNGSFVQLVPSGTIFYVGNGKALNMNKYFTDFTKRDLLAQDLNEINKNTGIKEEDFMSMI